jgi:energy-coupling factor transport system ATP-binding protein
MSAIIMVDNLSCRYKGSERWAIRDVSFSVNRGETLLLAGYSGSGKSTVLKSIVGLMPGFYGGECRGKVVVDGLPVKDTPIREIVKRVSYLPQNPENYFVTTTVESDVAFTLENLGMPCSEIKERVEWSLSVLGIMDLRKRSITELSEGQKQRVALAGAIASKPKVLLLDEPTGFMDSESAESLLKTINELKRNFSMTVIVAEHRIWQLLPYADKLALMDEGTVQYFGDPSKYRKFNAAAELSYQPSKPINCSPAVVIQLNGVFYKYGDFMVLKGVDLTVRKGELLFILGPNGSGKSTLLRIISGIYKPFKGNVIVNGLDTLKVRQQAISRIVSYIPQNPDHALFEESVLDELAFSAKNFKVYEPYEKARKVADMFKLSSLLTRSPFELSWGEKKRVSIASAIVWDPEIILMDEPTAGQDLENKKMIATIIHKLIELGKTVVVATHDIEMVSLLLPRARTVKMVDGKLINEGISESINPKRGPFLQHGDLHV